MLTEHRFGLKLKIQEQRDTFLIIVWKMKLWTLFDVEVVPSYYCRHSRVTKYFRLLVETPIEFLNAANMKVSLCIFAIYASAILSEV